MSVDMIAPQWMHSHVTAEDYESWSEEQCAGIEIVDGMVVHTYLLDSASRRYRDGEIFTGHVQATVPFPVEVDLSVLG